MTRLERSYMLMSASIVLLLLSIADLAEGTTAEFVLKGMATIFTLVLLVRLVTFKESS